MKLTAAEESIENKLFNVTYVNELSDEEIIERYFRENNSIRVVIISDCCVSMCICVHWHSRRAHVLLLLLPSVGLYAKCSPRCR
jgi:hypothetical protein